MEDEALGIGVVHRPEERRFVAQLDGRTAELTYARAGDRLVLIHTGVPSELEGRGIGGALVHAAIDWAAAEGLTVLPRCPFARRWLRAHPDVAASVPIDWTLRPPS